MRSIEDRVIQLIAEKASFKEATGVSKTRCSLINNLAKAATMGAFTIVLLNSHAQAKQPNSIEYNGKLIQAEETSRIEVQQAPVQLLVPQKIEPARVEQEKAVYMIVPEKVEMRVPEQVSVELATPDTVKQRRLEDKNAQLRIPEEVQLITPSSEGPKF